jgi:hypothetical protein
MRARVIRFTLLVSLLILGFALGSLGPLEPLSATAQPQTTIPIAWVAPPGFEQAGGDNVPCQPGIGVRWIGPTGGQDTRRENGVAGPLYLVDQGRLLGVQFEVSQADVTAGLSWRDIGIEYWGQPLTINHVDLRLTPAHAGFEEPHYALYLYVISVGEKAAVTCRS